MKQTHTIHFALNLRKGTNIKVPFIGTKAEAKVFASRYGMKHHLIGVPCYIWTEKASR